MVFKKTLKTIEDFESTIDKINQGNATKDEETSIDYIGFSFAQSIIRDVGKEWALQIANHIFAHYDW